MEYKIIIKEINDIEVISIRYKGEYKDIGKYFKELYKIAQDKVSGAPFALYYDEEYCEEADIEVCIPVKGKFDLKENIEYKIIKGGKFISTIHVGSYNKLHEGYKALEDYMKRNNIKAKVPSREIYLKGSGMILKSDPKSYETQIVIPFE